MIRHIARYVRTAVALLVWAALCGTPRLWAQSETFVGILNSTYGPGCSLSDSTVLADAENNLSSFMQAVQQMINADDSGACQNALTALQNAVCNPPPAPALGGMGMFGSGNSGGMMNGMMNPLGAGMVPGCGPSAGSTSPPPPPPGPGATGGTGPGASRSTGSALVTELEGRREGVQAQIAALTAERDANASDAAYVAAINAQLTILSQQLSEIRVQLVMARSTATEDDRRASEREATAGRLESERRTIALAVQYRFVVTNAVSAFSACRDSGQVLANMAGPLLSVMSGFSGMEAGSAAILQSMGQIFSDLVNYFQNAPYRDALTAADEARAPAAYFCTMERLTDQFCQTRLLQDFYTTATGDGPRAFGGAHAECSLTTGYPEFMNLSETSRILSRVIDETSGVEDDTSELMRLRERLTRLSAYAENAVRNIEEAIPRLNASSASSDRLQAASLERNLVGYRAFASNLSAAHSGISNYIANPSGGIGGLRTALGPLRASASVITEGGATGGGELFIGLQRQLSGLLEAESHVRMRAMRTGVPSEERNYEALETMSRSLAFRSVISGPDDFSAVSTAFALNETSLNQMSHLMRDRMLNSLRRLRSGGGGGDTSSVAARTQRNYLCNASLSLPDSELSSDFLDLCRGVPVSSDPNINPDILRGLPVYETFFERRGGVASENRRCSLFNERVDARRSRGGHDLYTPPPPPASDPGATRGGPPPPGPTAGPGRS